MVFGILDSAFISPSGVTTSGEVRDSAVHNLSPKAITAFSTSSSHGDFVPLYGERIYLGFADEESTLVGKGKQGGACCEMSDSMDDRCV